MALSFDLREMGLLYYVLASAETLGEAFPRVAMRAHGREHAGTRLRGSPGSSGSVGVLSSRTAARVEDPRKPLVRWLVTRQKSGLSARGTSASCPGYHLIFSAHTDSVQSKGIAV